MPFRLSIPTALSRALPIALLAMASGLSQAAITLTQAPSGMRKQSAEITLGWTGGQGRVHLRASTVPGSGGPLSHYDSLHLPSQLASGAFTFKINPDIPLLYRNTDLRFGVNYCILTDGTQASPEFLILIESGNAPTLASPANAAAIKDLTPTFAWTGDAPYYAILVSDEPFKISDDGTVTGVSAIWQAITPYTSIRYGDEDPSGFNTVPAPPLISGKTYNWLVLNNYGNNSASTSKVAPVPAAFVYAPTAPLPVAQLLEPGDKDTIPGSDQILFRWTQVDGAVSYKIELLEENVVDGSQADISLWKASSTGGQIQLDNAAGLLRRYNYKWRVYALGGSGSASLSEKRSFFYAASVGEISLTVKNQLDQKTAYAPVKLNRLGGASSAVFQSGSTDNDGILSIKNAPLGGYEIRIENLDGYLPKIDTLYHNSAGVTRKTIILSPVSGKILGKAISSANGTGILNAKVTASAPDGSQWSALTNSQGDFSMGLPLGNWQVAAQADGYAASVPVSIALNAAGPSKTADFRLVADKFTLSGKVQNSFTGQGIFGATVTLTQGGDTRSLRTDGNGSFSFSVPGGLVSLRISSAGFASPEPQAIAIDGDKSVSLSLDPNASILSGRTRDASGTAISRAIIAATPKAGPVRSVISDGSGAFEISLPAGDWILSGSASGFASASRQKFLLDASKTVQGVDFVFTANCTFIAGRVTANGSGLSGALVSAGAAEAAALSDNSGYYLLAVNAGTQTVQAAKEGFLIPKTYSVPANPGDTVAGIDFTASGNAGVVKGRVLAGGAGVVGAVIRAVNQSNSETFQGITDGEGSYTLSLPGAEYRVTAAKEGFALDKALSFPLASSGTLLQADIRLLPDQGGITGTVASGSAYLGGCEVGYRNGSDASLTGKTVTDPQGRYSLSLQGGSSYALTAVCPGYQPSSAVSAPLSRGGQLALDFNLTRAGAACKGNIYNARGGLSDVKVTADKDGNAITVTSDYAGAYAFSLGAGTYSFTLSKPGYRTVKRSAQVALGDNAPFNDTLITSVGRLAGRVQSQGAAGAGAGGESPVSGAFVTLTGLSPDAGGATFTTDGDGRFTGEEIPAGTYSLSATADGFSEGRLPSVTLSAGAFANADVSLIANRGTLSGTVRLEGALAANVAVVANAFGSSRSAVTGTDGSYRIDKLPAGSYTVTVAQTGYSPDVAYAGKTLAQGEALSGLDFALARNVGSLSGTVTGMTAASGTRLSLSGTGEGKNGYRFYAACDGAGKFAFPSLPVGTYALSVSAPGYKLAGATQTPSINIAGPSEFNPALAPAVFRLNGKVMDQSGSGISGLPIELRVAQEKLKTVSGQDGAYSFADVPAGQDYQLACKPPTADYDAHDTAFASVLDGPSQVTVNLSTLSRLAGLSGTVLLDGFPVEGATLRVTGAANNLIAISQPKGLYKLTGVAGSAAAISLSLAKPGAGGLDTSLSLAVGEMKTGLQLKLKTIKLAVTVTLRSSEGKPLAVVKLVASSPGGLDTLTSDSDGHLVMSALPANQTFTLATLLPENLYDNVETSVFLREKDTSFIIAAPIHASMATVEVRDQNGDFVDGAEVLLNGKTQGNTSQGKVSISRLAAGEYRFAAGKAGYRSGADRLISMSGDTSLTLTLPLAKVDGGLYGSVRDTGLDPGADGPAARSLPGAVVLAAAGGDTLRDTANSLGQYSLQGLVAGRKYALSLTLPGYVPLIDTVMGEAQARNLDLLLRPFPGSVLGRLATGAPGVRVVLSHAASGRIQASATQPGGYFAFAGLRNREDYSIQAVYGALSSPAVAFQGQGGAAKRIDLALDRWGGISGTVRGGTAPGSPLAGARVSVRKRSTGSLSWTLTDSSGGFAVAGLAPGAHEISVDRAGYRTPGQGILPVTLSVAKGSVLANKDFLLEETLAGISGQVADDSGRGIAATVTLLKGADTVKTGADGAGLFAFAGLAAGTYGLSASQPGYASPEAVEVAYAGKGAASRNLVLARRGNLIQGRVRDALTNVPLEGARVSALLATPITAATDSSGRFELSLPAGSVSPLYLEAGEAGHLTRSNIPVYLDVVGSSNQDIALTADYKFDGEIEVTVKEGKDPSAGLYIS
ncbi:MAG: carboxypeptidase-like regulatory domain-containing protein, partial [Fibrobacteria bacterium]